VNCEAIGFVQGDTCISHICSKDDIVY
jgi:hypothetical protein